VIREIRSQQLVRDFTQRLLRQVAIELVRATVPVSNAVLRVAHEDRFVTQIEQTRLFGQTLFRPFLPRDITDDFGMPIILPLRSLTGEMVSETLIRVPSCDGELFRSDPPIHRGEFA